MWPGYSGFQISCKSSSTVYVQYLKDEEKLLGGVFFEVARTLQIAVMQFASWLSGTCPFLYPRHHVTTVVA